MTYFGLKQWQYRGPSHPSSPSQQIHSQEQVMRINMNWTCLFVLLIIAWQLMGHRLRGRLHKTASFAYVRHLKFYLHFTFVCFNVIFRIDAMTGSSISGQLLGKRNKKKLISIALTLLSNCFFLKQKEKYSFLHRPLSNFQKLL